MFKLYLRTKFKLIVLGRIKVEVVLWIRFVCGSVSAANEQALMKMEIIINEPIKTKTNKTQANKSKAQR